MRTFFSLAIFALAAPLMSAEEIDFNRDVRPILSDNCFACHGFDKSSRKADLRLDTREGAVADLGGYAAIVPGKPDESELIRRIASDDEVEVMPPPDSHKKPLSKEAVATLTKWVQQGAKWGEHWAFVPPVRAPVPEGKQAIDYFVRKQLATRNRDLSPSADSHTLARRLSFDLTGLPPMQKQVERWQVAESKKGFSAAVDELLASPHYGERMAMWWLDGARYSDTDGFQQDATRTNWPWRDWVIESFNKNKPFDEFTVEQFAGDLLPDATAEQRMATCFHRNHMNNGEGGRDPEESRVDYVLDRVNTTGTLWLGLTLGCTQCHDHKFDPISQVDYYSLSAFFNSIDESGRAGGGATPFMKVRSPYAERAVKETKQLLATAEAELAAARAEADARFAIWLEEQIGKQSEDYQAWQTLQPAVTASVEGVKLQATKEGVIAASPNELAQDDYVITIAQTSLDRIAAVKLTVFPHESHQAGKYSFAETGEFILTNFKLRVRDKDKSIYRDLPLAGAVADVQGVGLDKKYGKVVGALDDDPRTGWTTRTKPAEKPTSAIFELREPVTLAENEVLDVVLMQRSLAPRELIARFQLSATAERGKATRGFGDTPMESFAKLTVKSAKDLPADLRGRLLNQYLQDQTAWRAAEVRRNTIKRQLGAVQKSAGDLNVMVLAERKEARKTHVLVRGVWDQHGEAVTPAMPGAVLKLPSDQPLNRLDLGRWVVSPDNPLTARVIVNQIWQQFFGAGLVRTPNDFGLQGEPPTHPELLDWLAVEFTESGWDVKHLVRTIVTSETYRQSSTVSAELAERDPDNRWLARGARFRLPSWMIRDSLLKSSGLLNDAIGGPPIFPWQPSGVWKDQFMGRFEYQPTLGPEQHRRTIYTFWRRSSAPTFLFDSAMRRTCEVVVRETNTPLHALTLMNDRTALAAARTLADDAAKESSENTSDQIQWLYAKVLSRPPTAVELAVCKQQLARSTKYYEANPADAAKFLTVAEKPPVKVNQPQRAAMMLLANTVLNLDEAITHE